jgi:transcription termination factor Rho
MSDMITGILKHTEKGAGMLRDPEQSLLPGPDDVFVPAKLVQEHGLPEGARVTGPVRRGSRGPLLTSVEQVCGLTPEVFRQRTPFTRLTPIDPHQRFELSSTGEIGMRVVDLAAPIGRGTRGLIVSPPKAGKTMLLEQIGAAIHATDPGARLIALLIDERPEEVTHFRRTTSAEVFASSSDQRVQVQMELAKLMLAHIRTELECGRHVVVLLDSLTRMARAFNLGGNGRGGGRTLSGGLDAGALEIPRRFFGLARAIEHGGSITIIATILVDTGSRMDQLIFEEFKGTGNSEIVLDRSLAQAYIFPAVNLSASGTRKEHLLYGRDEVQQVAKLRRLWAGRGTKDGMELLLRLLQKYPTNELLLQSLSEL